MKKYIFLFLSFLAFHQGYTQDWQWQNPLPQGNLLNSVYFTDANKGFVVGDAGTIIKTTDGGTDFIEEPILSRTIFSIYPNPASDKITISDIRKLTEEININIFNITGEQVIHEKFRNQTRIEMDVSILPKGMYLVKIQAKSLIESKKLVIQ
jgi:hypothetical protein